MRLKDSQHKRSNSVPLWLHYSQKRWKALPFFAFIGLAIFLLCNLFSIYAEEATTRAKLKVGVFEQKGTQKVPLEDANVSLDGVLYDSTDRYGKVTLRDVPMGIHMLEVKKSGFFTYKENLSIEYVEEREITLISGDVRSENIGQEPSKKDIERTLKIEVKDDEGLPVQDANIYLSGSFVGKTNGKGLFKDKMAVGKYTLRIEKEGYFPGTDEGKGIELTEYYAEERKITLKRIPVMTEKTATGKNILPKEQKKPKETVKVPAADKDIKAIASTDNTDTDDKGRSTKDTSKTEITLTVKVYEDTRSGRLPVKDARIIIDGTYYGVTDKNGLFKRMHVPGKYVLRVAKMEFKPEEKVIELTPYAESNQIVLKRSPIAGIKRDYNYMYVIIGSTVGSLGFIALGVIIFTMKKGGNKETLFMDSIGDKHAISKIQKIHVRFKPFKQRKGMSLIYLGKNPFNARQKVVFKVLKEEHHNEDGLWLFDNEKKIHQILKNNGSNKNQNHLAQYLYSGYLARNKKQRVIAFEYIEGVSLFEIINARKHTLRQAIEMGICICDPVMAIHCAGYCHLDLKPEHFIYKGQNRFILIDIATALKINDSVVTIFKSIPYSSPEQHRKGSVVDQRTDIYSLGVIIEELISSSTIGYSNSSMISSVYGIIGVMRNENPDARYRHIRDVKASLEMLLRSFVDG